MFKPKFNKVLVEIDDKDAKWGKGNDDSMLGASYREGKLLGMGDLYSTADHPLGSLESSANLAISLEKMIGKHIMWNEGHEAGTVFEENGKKYALIYWNDIVGVKDEQ